MSESAFHYLVQVVVVFLLQVGILMQAMVVLSLESLVQVLAKA